MSQPFKWRGGWYLWYHDAAGKRRRKLLAKTKTEAFDRWKASLKSGTERASKSPYFHTIAYAWLELQETRLSRELVSAGWLARASRTVDAFLAAHPRIKAESITPDIAVGWIAEGSSQAYERTEAQVLKQILAWAVPKYMPASPLAAMKLEKGKRRERLIDLADHKKFCREDKFPCARLLYWFCWWTGCRPIELRELRWEYLSDDCSRATLREHKTAKKKGPRVIYFNQNAQAILRHHRATNGPVFRNSRGRPWTKDALCRRVANLSKKTGVDVSAYAYRHSYITRALKSGMDAAVVAELTGTSLEMISRNYGHLDKEKEHLRRAALSVPSEVV